MSQNKRPWFKAHTLKVLHDHRLCALPLTARAIYWGLTALVAERGQGDAVTMLDGDLAWHLGCSGNELTANLAELVARELVERRGACVRLVDWFADQPPTSEAERKARLRRKTPHLRSVSRDSHGTVSD